MPATGSHTQPNARTSQKRIDFMWTVISEVPDSLTSLICRFAPRRFASPGSGGMQILYEP